MPHPKDFREFCFWYAGAMAAILIMIFATLVTGRSPRVVLSVLAAIVLTLHGGCLHLLVGIGRSTGGDQGYGRQLDALLLFSGSLVVGWALVLIRKSKPVPQPDAAVQSEGGKRKIS